jgi:hypothetical protein
MCTCGHRHPQAGCWLCDCRRHEATPPAPPVPVGPLPCPFCGSAAKLYPSNPALTGDAWTAVECANPECPVDVGVAIHQDSGHREAAIGLWNTRHAALRSPSPEPPAPDVLCPYGDPLCPCQDGDPCHYEGDNPMTPPCPKCRGTGHSEYTGYPDCDVVDCGACMGTGTASPSPEPPAPDVREQCGWPACGCPEAQAWPFCGKRVADPQPSVDWGQPNAGLAMSVAATPMLTPKTRDAEVIRLVRELLHVEAVTGADYVDFGKFMLAASAVLLDGQEVGSMTDVQAIAAVAWECVKTCKNYYGPPVMCPGHQAQAKHIAAVSPAPESREAIPRAEWATAVFSARNDDTVDPHQHIERLIQTGDGLADYLSSHLRAALRPPATPVPDRWGDEARAASSLLARLPSITALSPAERRIIADALRQSSPPAPDVREWLWLNHGHTGLYGDDGEMQCSRCQPWDYKRAPMLDVVKAAITARRECVIGRYCSRHGFIHGAEAEELRARLEALKDATVNAVLEDVDARDSLAYVETERPEDTTP